MATPRSCRAAPAPERRAGAGRRPPAARRTASRATCCAMPPARSSTTSARGWRRASRTPRRSARWPRQLIARPAACERARRPGRASSTRPGVIVHTNLGRAPWPEAAIEAARAAAASRSLLELDRETGRRGRRFRAAEDAPRRPDRRRGRARHEQQRRGRRPRGRAGRAGGGVAVSRGELVEIGGGVRIPEIVRRAGARLVEVGTTNRTRVADFEEPLADGRAAVVLRVHPVELRPERVRRGARSGRARRARPPPRRDRRRRPRLRRAPRHGRLRAGPRADAARAPGRRRRPRHLQRRQAGRRPAGRAASSVGPTSSRRLRKDPLARAMRPDKATLAAVAATLGLYRAGVAAPRDPGLADDRDAARRRSAARAEALVGRCRIGGPPGCVDGALESTVGGGSLPGETLPVVGRRARAPDRPTRLPRGAAGGRRRRSSGGSRTTVVVLDLRTVDPAPMTTSCRGRDRRARSAAGLARPGDGRRRHGRPHRPRQDDAAPRR